MANEFYLPDVGEGLTEATILAWYVNVGGEVGLDEPLVEVETDKAALDIPAPHAGVLLHQGAGVGDVVAVEALLAVVGEVGEDWQPADETEATPIVGTLDCDPIQEVAVTDGTQALPKVRRLAAELGVSLAGLVGSGVGGRVTETDVRSAMDSSVGPVERVPMSSTRKAIADHMSRAWREIPHVTTFGEVEAEPLFRRRADLGNPTLEALLLGVVAPLLVEFPSFNASISGSEIVYRQYYDIGFAVDTPAGLVVAVVKDASSKDVATLDAETRRLASAARNRRASADELRGQTFTISNIGAVGGRFGTPIVPLGTTAILSVGRADLRPVVREGEVVVGREFPLSLSYDHRAIDGSEGRAFMAAVIASLAGA